MSEEGFQNLKTDMLKHMEDKEYYVSDLYANADPEHRLNVRMVNEYAWHGIFMRHMLRRPARVELDGVVHRQLTVINCPSFKADPERHDCRSDTVIIALNLKEKLILIGGTEYAGENKKSVFTTLNYLLPDKGRDGDALLRQPRAVGKPEDSAVFFGLSGTGKTTLSADPEPGACRR